MKTKFLTAIFVLALLCVTSVSYAQGGRRNEHPRRTEVNQRLSHQRNRIDRKEEAGKMSVKKADKLQKEDHQVRKEEKLMASQDHGPITKQEKKTLNQQENHISKQIKNS